MNPRIIIFSGTTEGRRLSDMLADFGMAHLVCVASEYGSDMHYDRKFADVRTGRMNAEEMSEFVRREGYTSGDLIVDATHPYATEVTRNIAKCAGECGLKYIRVSRAKEEISDGKAGEAPVYTYGSIEECARALDKTQGNILLTTGSKELYTYCENISPDTLSRTYVRVLPSEESLNLCTGSGIEPQHIIAMHGPFSEEMNLAMIHLYDIKHLVTKESGSAGGYPEKINAAASAHIHTHVIGRPAEDDGVDVYEAYKIITGKAYRSPAVRRVYLIGYGMGSALDLTAQADVAISGSDAVFGASRIISGISHRQKYEMYKAEDIIGVLKSEPGICTCAIVFSGDSGFFSGASLMKNALEAWDDKCDVKILPGISSVSYMAARLGVRYDDALILSLHGRNEEERVYAVAEEIINFGSAFVLLSGDEDVRALAKALNALSQTGRYAEWYIDRIRLCVGYDLSYDDEKITQMSANEALDFEGSGPLILYADNPGYLSRKLIRVIDDDELIRDEIPMTKECIRHESVIRLGIRENDTVYDIGGGTGSVAIEIASLDPSVHVYTVEKKKSAVDLICRNVDRMQLKNVTVIEGEAPGCLAGLPAPDEVFIGGSMGRLKSIVETVSDKRSGIRYVVTAVSLETADEIRELAKEKNASELKMTWMQISDVVPVGEHHMMRAQNPVMICSFVI